MWGVYLAGVGSRARGAIERKHAQCDPVDTFDAASVDIVNRIKAPPETAPKYVVPAEDGIDFCRKAALSVKENVLCLQVNRKPPPKF